MKTFENINVYNLLETTFIGGTYKELYFYLNTSSGCPINTTSASLVWTLSPLSQPDYVAVSKAGVGRNGYFVVTLNTSDTKDLTGKYIQRPMINNVSGSAGNDYRFGQGIINIIPAIHTPEAS